MIVSGCAISLRSARVEGAVVQCLKDWATAHPDELIALDDDVRMLRHVSGTTSGRAVLTEQRTMLPKARIPMTLNTMLQLRIDKDWLVKDDLRRLVFDHFKVGMISRNPETNKWR